MRKEYIVSFSTLYLVPFELKSFFALGGHLCDQYTTRSCGSDRLFLDM